MRTIFLMLAVALLICMAANAAIINCPAPPPPTQNVATGGFMLTCNGLTFMNFTTVDQGGIGISPPPLNMVAATYDSTTNDVFLSLNPQLGASQSLGFYFQVKGGINAIDLSVGGSGATVTERACANAIPTTGAFQTLCTNAAQTAAVTALAEGTVTSTTPGQPVAFNLLGNPSFTTPVYIYTTVTTAAGGAINTLSQSFHSAALVIPEPLTVLLLGSGLLGLGLAGVRRRR